MLHCPHCPSRDVRRSTFHVTDVPRALLLQAPYRCRGCGSRFHDFFWKGVRREARQLLHEVKGAVRDALDVERERASVLMQAPSTPNRRVWLRHVGDWEGALRDAPLAVDRQFPARIKDVSCGGVKLLSHHEFDVGAILTVQVAGRSFLAEVKHVSPLADGSWSLGCRFTKELSEAELAAFVKRS